MKHSMNSRRGREIDPVEMLRADLEALRRDFSAVTSNGIGRASDYTRETIGEVASSIADAAETAKVRAVETHRKLSEVASERPLTTIALAIAGGAIAIKVLGFFNKRH